MMVMMAEAPVTRIYPILPFPQSKVDAEMPRVPARGLVSRFIAVQNVSYHLPVRLCLRSGLLLAI
ncbi:hypothetical protein BJY00DRAFT_274085 [Aspergillus carlsbadensis]|nr:hypothetical protein BJY00DRAFT_274085 [Aspergillus carlsbadensis]